MSDLDAPLDLHEPHSSKAEAVLQDAQEDGDLKWLMADPRGRRIARRLLEQGGLWRSSFTPDPQVTAFNEGVRAAGLRLLDVLMRAAPEVTARVIAGRDGK